MKKYWIFGYLANLFEIYFLCLHDLKVTLPNLLQLTKMPHSFDCM